MKKRLFACLLVVCSIAAFFPTSALAVSENDVAVQTVRALGIIVGDESGTMHLERNVTRAQFAKMLVASSTYRDTISPDGVGYSLYRDVKSNYWGSEFIRLVVREGWMTGFSDGTFRPDESIVLEEACSSLLKLLGYDGTSLAGSYPYAQLSKASAIGLRDRISLARGATLTRGDCAYLFYNLMTAENKNGKTYAETLGYSIINGQIDYITIIKKRTAGPFVAEKGSKLPFTPETIYRDGKTTKSGTLNENDIYYYCEFMNTAWIYTKRVSGKVEAITQSNGSPSAVTISNNSYQIGSSEASYQLSALAGTSVGNYVTLLLGMDDVIAGVLIGEAVNGTYYGVVQSYTKSSSSGNAAQTDFTVFCTDGVTRVFTVLRNASYSAGSVVKISITKDGVDIKSTTTSRIAGKVNSIGTRIGSYALAENVHIIDIGDYGAATVISPNRIANVTFTDRDVRFYTLNAEGEVDNLILNDVTGDTWKYAYLTNIDDQSAATDVMNIDVTYTWLKDGISTSLYNSNAKYNVKTGGIALIYERDGATIRTMRQMPSLNLDEINSSEFTATVGNRSYHLSDSVQVYLRYNGVYYLTNISAINANDYVLTGWYDDFTGSAGGLIRIILAVSK